MENKLHPIFETITNDFIRTVYNANRNTNETENAETETENNN